MKHYLVVGLIAVTLWLAYTQEGPKRIQTSDNESDMPLPPSLTMCSNTSNPPCNVTYSGTLGSGDNLTLTRQPNPGYEEYSTITTGQQNTCMGYESCNLPPFSTPDNPQPVPSIK